MCATLISSFSDSFNDGKSHSGYHYTEKRDIPPVSIRLAALSNTSRPVVPRHDTRRFSVIGAHRSKCLDTFSPSNPVASSFSNTYKGVGIMAEIEEDAIIRPFDCQDPNSSITMTARHSRVAFNNISACKSEGVIGLGIQGRYP